jgi:hypothetical protein
MVYYTCEGCGHTTILLDLAPGLFRAPPLNELGGLSAETKHESHEHFRFLSILN